MPGWAPPKATGPAAAPARRSRSVSSLPASRLTCAAARPSPAPLRGCAGLSLDPPREALGGQSRLGRSPLSPPGPRAPSRQPGGSGSCPERRPHAPQSPGQGPARLRRKRSGRPGRRAARALRTAAVPGRAARCLTDSPGSKSETRREAEQPMAVGGGAAPRPVLSGRWEPSGGAAV